jgi:hypothetical protein
LPVTPRLAVGGGCRDLPGRLRTGKQASSERESARIRERLARGQARRARTRSELLAATEKLLAPIIARVQAGRLAGAGAIGVETGKVISKYKTGKHFDITITGTSLTVTRKQAQIDDEAALDDLCVGQWS